MTSFVQGTLDTAITPRRILFGHAHDERLDLLSDTVTSQLTAVLTPVTLLGDQSFKPAHEGVWRHEGGHLVEALVAEWMGKRREATAFRVGQAQPAATEPGFKDTIFRKEIHDDLLLVPLEPASDHGDQDLEHYSRSSGERS
jgi:hypothetical protein